MKGMAIHLVLAIVGLSLAYRAWTLKDEAEETGSAESVMLAECGVDALESVTFSEANRTIKLSKKRDGGAPYYWIEQTSKLAAPEGAGAMEERKQSFAVAKEVAEYVDELLPLRAKRSLGSLGADQLKQIKLDKPESTFTLVCGGKTYAYELGAPAFGSGDHYFRPKGQGTVYLVAKATVGELSRAESTLMRRDLFAGELTEVEHLVVRTGAGEKRLLQRNRLDPKQAEWVDAAAPDVRNELYNNWFTKVKQLRVEKYLQPNEAPGQDLPTPKLGTKIGTLEYLDKSGKRLDLVELAYVEQELPAYYAKSTATRSWVRVLSSIGKQVSADLPSVLGMESSAP